MRPLLPLDTLKMGPHCRFHGWVGHLRTPDGKLGCVYCLHGLDMPEDAAKILSERFEALDVVERAQARAAQATAG